ncbi:MAG: hypothetical protein AAFQ14_12465 [Cyanobacteria bacterium J06621_12]
MFIPLKKEFLLALEIIVAIAIKVQSRDKNRLAHIRRGLHLPH